MTRFKNLIPENWLFKISSITLTTTFTFYLFEFISEFESIHNFQSLNEKNYIRSFLFFQVIINGFFYIAIAHLFKYFFLIQIKRRLNSNNYSNLSFNELRELSYFKSFLIRFFCLKIRQNNSSDNIESLINLEFVIENKEKEINDISHALGRWSSLFVHLACTLILVYHLSSWYILPLLLSILVLIFFFCLAASLVIKNIEFLERMRLSLLKRLS